jgi:hypothetical protein
VADPTRSPSGGVDAYYRRHEVWDAPFVYGHVEIPGDEHWDPGSLDYPA